MKIIQSLILVYFFVSCAQVDKIKNVDLGIKAPDRNKKELQVSWVKNLDPVYNSGNLPIGTSAPLIFEDIIYMGSLKGDMTAYDASNGRIIWSKDEKQPIQAQALKVGENLFYGTLTGRLFVRNYLTGKLVYNTDLGAPIESQPSFVDGRLLVHLRDHSLVCIDAQTGKVFWKYKRSIPFTTTLQRVSRVVSYQGNLLIGFADGAVASLSLEEGILNWEQRISQGSKFVDVDVTPTVHNNKIIAGSASGPMSFINPMTGAIEKTIDLYQSSNPVLVGTDFIVGDIFGVIYLLDKFGKISKKVKLTKNAISSIKKWKNGYVVATMGSEVFYLDSYLEIKDKFDLGSQFSAVFGSVEVSEATNIMSIYSSRNRLFVFK